MHSIVGCDFSFVYAYTRAIVGNGIESSMAKLQYSKLSVVVLLALLTSCQNPINSILQQKAEYKHATAKFSNVVILHESSANKKNLTTGT